MCATAGKASTAIGLYQAFNPKVQRTRRQAQQQGIDDLQAEQRACQRKLLHIQYATGSRPLLQWNAGTDKA